MSNSSKSGTLIFKKIDYFWLMGLLIVMLFFPALTPPAAYAQTDCNAVIGTSQIQCEALVALYNSTNGSSWLDSPANNWNVTNTPCNWTGVTCSGGNVVKIDRLALGLTGTIPPELSNLANLQELWLSYNKLSGHIPPELGNLANLEMLLLTNNQLSGSIPPEFGNLAKLKELWLSNNRLGGSIPPELGNLANLRKLHLARNQLLGNIPPKFGSLSGLNLLDIAYNGLSATDEPLKLFLAGKDPDWYLTQTVAPDVVGATVESPTAIRINWSPIVYTHDGGYYQVKYSTNPGGPFIDVATPTADKTAGSYLATNLSPGTTYFFVVVTHTPAHASNKNAITSTMSNEVSATTQSPGLTTIFLPLIMR